jgi:hypothetical protein
MRGLDSAYTGIVSSVVCCAGSNTSMLLGLQRRTLVRHFDLSYCVLGAAGRKGASFDFHLRLGHWSNSTQYELHAGLKSNMHTPGKQGMFTCLNRAWLATPVGIAIAVLSLGSGHAEFAAPETLSPYIIAQFCPQDAKQCPDGSYVSRTGPSCTFAPCSGASTGLAPGTVVEPAQVCPQDAKQCPDGSYVSRTGPKLRFRCMLERRNRAGARDSCRIWADLPSRCKTMPEWQLCDENWPKLHVCCMPAPHYQTATSAPC